MSVDLAPYLAELGLEHLAGTAELDAFVEAARRLSPRADVAGADAARFASRTVLRLAAAIAAAERGDHPRPASLAILIGELALLEDLALADRIADDTRSAAALVALLRSDRFPPIRRRIEALFPEIAALANVHDATAGIEHDPADRPLVAHLERSLAKKLLGLELGDRLHFEDRDVLEPLGFHHDQLILERARDDGLLPAIRIALLHLDFAKGGSAPVRTEWQERHGADLSVHNLAARRIVERAGVLDRFSATARYPAIAALVLALIETHGLTGQAVRGETPLVLFAPFVRFLRVHAAPLKTPRIAMNALHVLNVVDTAAVREGLYDITLHRAMTAIEDLIVSVADRGDALDLDAIERELAAADDARWHNEGREDSSGKVEHAKRALTDRLSRLRASRTAAGEDRSMVERLITELSPRVAEGLFALSRNCQLWYAEAATASLSPEAQLKVLALGMKAAEIHEDVDVTRPYHLTLLPLVAALRGENDRAVPYRVRLVETALDKIAFDDILDAKGHALSILNGGTELPVVGFATEIGRSRAVALAFEESDEARALLVLLPIYETKSSAAFHATLKTLCDLYGLRKDEFDRVANESTYLTTMNTARSDKARMLDFVKPGRIVEVGPGGGVVLDLLEARFPTSEIVGIDTSRMVIESLEAKKKKERRRWKLIEADAFELGAHVGRGAIDCVIFCSVLHEIYSYVERPTRFSLESVRDILRAAFEVLAPGGRIVIRDGVMPPPGTRTIRFLTKDARGLFALFASQFQGRKIVFDTIDEDRVRLSSADAMEFLFKLTWGPASFPYEIREQYGVLTYAEYTKKILEWLPGARLVPLPKEMECYLQDGYRHGLSKQMELFEGERQVELPDSNCLIVVERI